MIEPIGNEKFLPLVLKVLGVGGLCFTLGSIALWFFFQSLEKDGDGTAKAHQRPLFRLGVLVGVTVAMSLLLVWLAGRG